MNIKIGTLIPHSKSYPAMGKDFVNGLKLGVKNANFDCSFIVEGIGLGADEKVIIDKAQKLTIQDDVSIITGLLGHIGIEELQEYVKNTEVMLLYSDLGATIPKSVKNNPWVFCNSLELYLSAMLFGKNAVKWGYKNIALSSSYYDSGYGFTAALEKTLYQSGGAFSGHFTTPLHPRENESEIMSDFIKEVKPDAIFAFHSGIFAKENAEYLIENKIIEKIPFYSTVFGVDNQLIKENISTFVGVKCISPWLLEEKRNSNEYFIESYRKEYGKPPSAFAMLGYENGLIINNALKKLETNNVNSHKLKNVLPDVKIEGPRGMISFDSEINRTSFPHYLWELKEGVFIKREELESHLELTKMILNDPIKQIGGWHNAYLCN